MKRYLVTFEVFATRQKIQRSFDNYKWAFLFTKQMPCTYYGGEEIKIDEPAFENGGYYQNIWKDEKIVAKISLKQLDK